MRPPVSVGEVHATAMLLVAMEVLRRLSGGSGGAGERRGREREGGGKKREGKRRGREEERGRDREEVKCKKEKIYIDLYSDLYRFKI